MYIDSTAYGITRVYKLRQAASVAFAKIVVTLIARDGDQQLRPKIEVEFYPQAFTPEIFKAVTPEIVQRMYLEFSSGMIEAFGRSIVGEPSCDNGVYPDSRKVSAEVVLDESLLQFVERFPGRAETIVATVKSRLI